MKTFLRPTKVTWLVLPIIFITNALIGYGFFVLNGDISLLLQAFGLLVISLVYEGTEINVGTDVRGEGFWIPIPMPNALGWVMIILTLLINLVIYYVIASVISKYYYHRKQARNQ